MFLHSFILSTWIIVTGAVALKVTKLSVPDLVDVRTTAVLICEFDLENSKLYSVKWYKDELEFFRFMPDGSPDVQIFDVEGVHLHLHGYNKTAVKLDPLKFATSGSYTCEVSTEAPYFKTVQASSNMTVLGIPTENPKITGVRDVYAVGDYVKGNCTSDPSFPPSALEWFINGNQVESWQLETYGTVESDNEFRLTSSILGVSFQADHGHFSGPDNTMVLKCVATVRNFSRRTRHASKLADLDLDKSAQGLFGNGASGPDHESFIWTWFTVFCIVFRRS